VVLEVEDMVGEGNGWAEVRVPTASQADDFTVDAIFLGGKHEDGKSAGTESGFHHMPEGEPALLVEELDIAEEEGLGLWAHASIFSGL